MKYAMIQAMRNYAALHSCTLVRVRKGGWRWEVHHLFIDPGAGFPIQRHEEENAALLMRTITGWAEASKRFSQQRPPLLVDGCSVLF